MTFRSGKNERHHEYITQRTQEERYQIYALMKAGHNPTEIAEVLGRHKSTISREFKRNRGMRGYRPKQAQELTHRRRQAAHGTRISLVAGCAGKKESQSVMSGSN
jgi:IS30 family transposase